jgi:hypothetical protein
MYSMHSSVCHVILFGVSLAVGARCVGPAVNQATLDLVKEFEGFRPDICKYSKCKHNHRARDSDTNNL